MNRDPKSLRPAADDTALHVEQKGEAQIALMSEVDLFSELELDRRLLLRERNPAPLSLNRFRELRTQLLAHSNQRNFVVLVTAVRRGGGASYVARNLAAAFALEKSKTSVLVDANFYHPCADDMMIAAPNLGLSEFLREPEMGLEFVLYASGVRRLRVVPAGDNPEKMAEALGSEKMGAALRELRGRYPDRFIVVDGPSVGENPADVSLLAKHCDFALVVVPYGEVSSDEVNACIASIGQARVAGVVLNAP